MTYGSKYTSGSRKTQKEAYAQAPLQMALINSLKADAAEEQRELDEKKAAEDERQRMLDEELEELDRKIEARRAETVELQRKLDEKRAAIENEARGKQK